MRVALIKDGVVENVVLADDGLACEAAFGAAYVYAELTAQDAVGVGYTWDGETFAPPAA